MVWSGFVLLSYPVVWRNDGFFFATVNHFFVQKSRCDHKLLLEIISSGKRCPVGALRS